LPVWNYHYGPKGGQYKGYRDMGSFMKIDSGAFVKVTFVALEPKMG